MTLQHRTARGDVSVTNDPGACAKNSFVILSEAKDPCILLAAPVMSASA